MNYYKSKNGFVALSVFALALTACNNHSSTDSDYDTTATTVEASPSDTAQNLNGTDTASLNGKSSISQGATAQKKYKASIQAMPASTGHKYTINKAGIYDFAEVMPEYPGGQSALEDYINNNIQYPQAALDNGDAGRATVKFIVDENGKIEDATSVGTKLNSGLDNEAVRVVSSMPAWKPGTVKGKPVKVSMTLPVVFRVQQ